MPPLSSSASGLSLALLAAAGAPRGVPGRWWSATTSVAGPGATRALAGGVTFPLPTGGNGLAAVTCAEVTQLVRGRGGIK